MMRIGLSQIFSSMRHRKSAYVSLVLEVALGSTVVAYSLGLGSALHRLSRHHLGFDEKHTFVVSIERPAMAPADRELDELRKLPGVEAAAWVALPPVSRALLPEQVLTSTGPRRIWPLHGDPALVAALGVRIREGRALTEDDAAVTDEKPALITGALAEHLGPHPIGAVLRLPQRGALRVVGILDSELGVNPFLRARSELVLTATHPDQARRSQYVVRTTPAATVGFAKLARERLRETFAERAVEVEAIVTIREAFVRDVDGANTIIVITVLGMVLVVLVGSIGMASSLIVERTRQIGIRRALGARKVDIIAYFMLENLFATLLGITLGAVGCIVLDQLLLPVRGTFQIAWPGFLPLAGGLFVLAGQVSVLLPSHRAACGACRTAQPRIA